MKKFLGFVVSVLALSLVSVWALPEHGIIVYATDDNLKKPSPLNFVVINNGEVSDPKVLTTQKGKDMRISPDGKYVAFHDAENMFVCELMENAEVHNLGEGFHPFWVKKDGDWHLFYSSLTGKKSFENGKSFLQKIDLEKFELVGDKVEVKYDGKSSIMKGGMNLDGSYAANGYPDAVLAEADGSQIFKAPGGQKCNVSVAPDQGKILVLDDTRHETVAIYDMEKSKIRNGPLIRIGLPGLWVIQVGEN